MCQSPPHNIVCTRRKLYGGRVCMCAACRRLTGACRYFLVVCEYAVCVCVQVNRLFSFHPPLCHHTTPLKVLESGNLLCRKNIVLYVVQQLQQDFPQATKTSVGHVVQLLYRASCFNVSGSLCTYMYVCSSAIASLVPRCALERNVEGEAEAECL